MALEERTGNFGTYWGNTYDSSNTLTTEQMQVNAEYLYKAFSSYGWTINAICRNVTEICSLKVQ